MDWKRTGLTLLIGLLCIPAASAVAGDVSVENLRCEYLKNPRGIDVRKPRLSWKLRSDERGQKQTAYRVLVASSAGLLRQNTGDLWDTGKVQSDQSIQLTYDGEPLKSRMECHWKVRVWDADGEATDWSEPAHWSMGLLTPGDWKAEWIGLDSRAEDNRRLASLKGAQWIWYPEGAAGGKDVPPEKRLFRKTVRIPDHGPIAAASLRVLGDNNFAVWVNGQQVGSGGLNGIKNPDVYNHLKTGRNVIAVQVQNVGETPNPAGLIASLEIEYTTGKRNAVLTDGTWKTAKEPAEGWQQPGFDDGDWESAEIVAECGAGPWGDLSNKGVQDRRLAARYLRKDFDVEKDVERAAAYVCGLGLFELRLNGDKVGDHVLEPGLTEYNERCYYVTFDVTSELNRGDNAVGVILGNGRFYAPRTKVPVNTRTYGYPKLLLQMEIEYADGSRETVVSDGSWRLTDRGPIRANNEYDGEDYDARMEMPEWDAAGFDDGDWRKPELVDAPDGELSAQMIEPIRVTKTLEPVKVTEPKPGVHVYDMGQNLVGWCRLKVSGPKGSVVRLRHAEAIKDDGTLYMANLRSAEALNTYILKGDGREVYEPRFTYHGFRYVELTGSPEALKNVELEGRVVHDDLPRTSRFRCSNDLLNRITRNVRWGVRGNYRSFVTDCPQRDERHAWLGDRAVESRGESYLYNIAPLYTKWFEDIVDGQKANGSISDVSPPYWPFYSDNVTWPSLYIVAPGMVYEKYGDRRVLEQHYPTMKKWIELMRGKLKDGITSADTYGDWCVPPESPELIHTQDPGRKTAGAVLATSYLYHDLRLMARYADLLGKTDDKKEFNSLADRIRKAFNDRFFKPAEDRYDNGSQTSYVLPLAFDLVPEGKRKEVFNGLTRKIVEESERHIGVGLIGAQWLMRTLTDYGRPDLAYTIANQTDYPSWGYMIEQGATTVWELWNGDTANPAMNSRNHVMLVGDLYVWFNEYLAGIRSDWQHPGFKHIILKPVLAGDLEWVKARHDCPYGPIVSEWEIHGKSFEWHVSVPANTTATVYVPTSNPGSVKESGSPADEATGVSFEGMEEGRAVFEVQSGDYRFESELR